MALLGTGVLAIWNGIAEAAEDEFVRWHVREHIPERVGLPGFLRGRRYVAGDGHPKYFNFYETTGADALQSPVYRDRLNNPSAWTQRVVKDFRDTIRTVCDVSVSLGQGEGAFVETIRLGASPDESRLADGLRSLLSTAIAADGIVGAHLLRGRQPAGTGTAESALRSQPDRSIAWIVLIEGVDPGPLGQLRTSMLTDRALAAAGAAGDLERGFYRLQYALAKADLAVPTP